MTLWTEFQIGISFGSCISYCNIFSFFAFFKFWTSINHSLSYHSMESIVNCSPCKAFGDKDHKLNCRTVKQENLAEIEIWATTLGYNWNYVCSTASASLVMHLRKNLNIVMYWKSTRKKSMETIRQGGQRVSMEDHIQNFIATRDHMYCCNLSGSDALIVSFTTNGMCAKNKNICMWREQAMVEWSRRVISIVACYHGANLCAHAARDFRSQQNGAVTRMWRSCAVQPSYKERVIGAVRCIKEEILLQPLRWCCIDVWFTTSGMCAKNKNICMWEQAMIEWSHQVIPIVACCHGVKHCAHAAQNFRSQQYYICLLQLIFVSKYVLMIILL